MVVLRRTIGDVLRDERRGQQRTLREVSSTARVSLGYLSEVERGQKEASSELLASICGALDVPLSRMLGEVTRRIADEEGAVRPAVPTAYRAEGVVPAPVEALVPALPAVEPVPPVEVESLETVMDGAVEAVVDSAVEGLATASAREFAVELAGLPDELELVLRRRLLPAA